MPQNKQNKAIVVDGANVAHEETASDGKPKLGSIANLRGLLIKNGYDPIIIIDAKLHHEIDNPQDLQHMIENHIILQAPAGTDADFFVLETADQQGLHVVSNDQYHDYENRYNWIKDRRISYMIINGDIILYDKTAEQQPTRHDHHR